MMMQFHPVMSKIYKSCKFMETINAGSLWLLLFIENASKEMLANFLCFVTGSRSCTSVFAPGSISVHNGNAEAIHASTCTLDLKIPIGFSDYIHIENSMVAVMRGKMYNTA